MSWDWFREIMDLEIICTISACVSLCVVTFWVVKRIVRFVKWIKARKAKKRLLQKQKMMDEVFLSLGKITNTNGNLASLAKELKEQGLIK